LICLTFYTFYSYYFLILAQWLSQWLHCRGWLLPRHEAADNNVTEALRGSDAAVCRGAECRPTASPQRATKVEIENVEVPCYCLAPAFTTKQTHIMHSDFDVAMLGVRKYEI
jgi:hypothetical protein